MARENNRANDELRKIRVKRDYSKYAQGSCLLEMGKTKVLCTATADKNLPLFLRNSGRGWLTAEYRMLPCATQTRTQRDRVSGRNMEIQRLIGRSLRSVVDFEKLGEKTIWIDCDVIQADGGTRTASIIGGFIALADCVCALHRQKLIHQVCLTGYVGAISVGYWQNMHLLDLTYLEDSQADVDLNVVMKHPGHFIELQGTAEQGTYSKKDLNEFLNLAEKGIAEIIAMEKEMFKDIL